MAGIWLPSTRIAQPQSAVQPANQGIGSAPCFVVTNRPFRDAITGTSPNAAPAYTSVTSDGVGIAASTLTYNIAPIIGPAVSILYVGTLKASATRQDIVSQSLAGSPYTQLTISANSNTAGNSNSGTLSAWGYSGGFNGTWTKDSVIDGRRHVYILTKDAAGNLSIYIDGVLTTPAASSAVTTWYASTQTLTYQASGALDTSSLVAGWNRLIGLSEAAALSANPWSIFEDEQTYFPFSASGIPTLSAAAMSGITSTGGYPRVTRA